MNGLSPRSARKPVVALMGEFSAGKSTLTNLLLDETLSPVKVTATQMPPILFTYGFGQPVRVGLDGSKSTLSVDELHEVSVDDTAYVVVRTPAGVLELMDIIDMPGISDPNLSSESWKRTIDNADVVVWCTHATQAWRQSEAATWSELPASLHESSLLLLTRFDKLMNEKDRQRVVNRVTAETQGLFKGIFPVALLQASAAGDDREAWERSGVEAFMQELLDTVFEVASSKGEQQDEAMPEEPLAGNSGPATVSAFDSTARKAAGPIVPTRIKRVKREGELTERPSRSSRQECRL